MYARGSRESLQDGSPLGSTIAGKYDAGNFFLDTGTASVYGPPSHDDIHNEKLL